MSERRLPAGHNAIRSAVTGFGRFRRRWAVLAGLGAFVLAGPGPLVVWFLADWLIGLPAWPLLGSLVAVGAVGLWAAVRWLVRPMLRRVRAEREAVPAAAAKATSCPSCGAELPRDARFCPGCGVKLAEPEGAA